LKHYKEFEEKSQNRTNFWKNQTTTDQLCGVIFSCQELKIFYNNHSAIGKNYSAVLIMQSDIAK
jgi:hypothetical protein